MTNKTAMIEQAGFKLDAAGKVRTAEGKPIKAEVAEQVLEGNILANFDINALKKEKARKSVSGDLEEALNKISPAIALLSVGQTARVPFPDQSNKRSFVMSITAKLSNLCAAGRKWAGRDFDTVSGDDGILYVARLPDLDEPKVRKTGGGRKKGSGKAASGKSASESLKDAIASAKVHLSGDEDENDGGAAVMPDKQQPVVSEEAQVVTH